MRMRLILLGGGSALGQALIRLGAQEDIEFLAPRPPTEGWEPASLSELLNSVRPDAVVNLSYYFDWFQARQPDEGIFVRQELALQRLAELCRQQHAILVQPSSYRVFDGQRSLAYSERDALHPLDARGELLRRAEQRLKDICPRYLVLRFGWLLDSCTGGGLDRFLREAASQPLLALAEDRRGNPTPLEDAARVLLAVLKQLDCEASAWGVYHYGGQEATTALALGQALLTEAQAHLPQGSAQLIPLAHRDCPDAATEPQNGVLACKKILHTFGIQARSWRAALPGLLKNYYAGLSANQQ